MIWNTKRLILRSVVEEDAEAIFEYSREPNVGPNAGWKPHESIEETRQIMQTVFLNRDAVFVIIVKESNKLVGTIGLITDPKRENENVRMLGYALSEQVWGYGYMTEAVAEIVRFGFRELHLEAVSAYCYPFNTRSKRVLEKNDFQYEGCLSLCEKRYDGRVESNDCYILLNDQKQQEM